MTLLTALLLQESPAADNSGSGMIRTIAGVLAVILVVVIILRRKRAGKKEEDEF